MMNIKRGSLPNAMFFCILLLFSAMLSCTQSSQKNKEQQEVTKIRVPDVLARTVEGKTIRLTSLYQQAPMVLYVYLGTGCPMCVMNMKQLSQHAHRIQSYGWQVVALSNDSPEDNRSALQYPNFDSSFVQPGGNFAIELLSDTDHQAMEALGCYRRGTNTERHGMFLIDRQGYIRFSAIDRRPFSSWQFLIDSLKAIESPNISHNR